MLPTPSHAARAGLAAAGLAVLAGALTLNRNLVGVFYDDGVYAALGWALGHGLGYVHPNLPGTPAAVHFPPLYPLLLAPLFGSFPVAVAALAGKVLNVGLAAVGAGLIAWHATRRELLGPDAPRWLPAVVVAAASLAVPVLTVLTALLSEPLFGLLLAAAIVCADDLPAGSGVPSRGAVLAGVAAAAALLARSIGGAAGGCVRGFLVVGRRGEAENPPLTPPPVGLAALGVGGGTPS